MHIPFCASRCSYCDFYSTTLAELSGAYAGAVVGEIGLRKDYLGGEKISTLYFGGGTPSVVPPATLKAMVDAIGGAFDLSELREFTIECNPDDLSPERLAWLRETGADRLSMGIQSFDDGELELLGRRHDSEGAVRAFRAARDAGFDNISIDLMFALPHQGLESWERSIDAALELGAEHISAYCLSFERGTRIYALRGTEPDEDTAKEMYDMLCRRLRASGYEHYEISNFCRPGFRSRHNSSYWTGEGYLGLGAAAHSFDGVSRSANIASLKGYIEGVKRGGGFSETEVLSADDRYNELIITALRTSDGLEINRIDEAYRERFLRLSREFISRGEMSERDGRFAICEDSLFVSDYIFRELMI